MMTNFYACIASLALLIGNVAFADTELAFILRARSNPYWNSVAQGIEDAARTHNVKATIFILDSDTSVEEQLNVCNAAIQRKPAFLAITAITSISGINCLKRAAAAGIHVGDIDVGIDYKMAEGDGLHLDYSIGSDNRIIGHKAAEHAISLLGDGPDEVLVIEGAPGAQAGAERVAGFKESLRKLRPNIRIVGSMSGDWDRLKAMSITSATLLRSPNLKLIFAANDGMAIGAIQALKTQNRLGKVYVIGVDGTDEARQSLLRGELSATVAQLPFLLGTRALELALDIVRGKTIEPRQITETPILTKEILNNPQSSALRYVR